MTENTSSPSQKGRIFISYRRTDSAGYAGRIYDRLVAHFGVDTIFMDVDTIEGGTDFVDVLEDAVQSCDVLIALIGKQWLSLKDNTGERRLDNPEDFVRIEVAAALKRKIRVIPVLVDGAEMPQPMELPENLRALARRNALQVNHHSFNPDAYRLIEHLESALGEAERSRVLIAPALRVENEKVAKEKARLEAEEQAREAATKKEAERNAAEKATQERAQRRDARIAVLKKQFSSLVPLLRVTGFTGFAAVLLGIGWWTFSNLYSQMPTATPSATVPLISPTKTLTRTPTITPSITYTPTLTPTLTPIPARNILLQRNFELGDLGLWSQKGGHWVIEQDPEGNRYLAGSSSSMQPRISYSYQDPRWTDYALETRVKFIKGYNLSIQVRDGCLDHPCYYEVAIRNYGIDFYGSNRGWLKIAGPISRTFDLNRWYIIRVEIKDDLLSLYIDNALVQDEKLLETINSLGDIPYGGIVFVLDIGSEVYFDDIRVWTLN